MQQTQPQLTLTESRALELLGQGIEAEYVARAVGVDASRIAQLLAQEDFAALVAERRFASLQKHNARDSEYDKLEDELIAQLKRMVSLAVKPMEIARIMQIVNAAKRRGQTAPATLMQQNTIIQLALPVQIVQKFQLNTNNQVVEAGEQKLVTMQSNSLLKQIEGKKHETHSTTLAAPTVTVSS